MNTVLFKVLKYIKHKIIVPINRTRLHNYNFTIISNNCAGGIMYHDLGERFNSPTINLMFHTYDYFTFLENLQEALQSDIVKSDSAEEYPVGIIKLNDGKEIKINFMHYKTFSEAKNKWKQRAERVNYDNLFIFMEGGIETTDEMVSRFVKLPFENKILITSKDYGFECTKFIDIYGEDYTWGKLIRYKPNSWKRYLDNFDYVSWLNLNVSKHRREETGGN